MKKNCGKKHFFGILALASLVLPAMIPKMGLSFPLFLVCAILFVTPGPGENFMVSLSTALTLLLISVCVSLSQWRIDPFFAALSVLAAYVVLRGTVKYHSSESLLAGYGHWNYLEDSSRLFYFSLIVTSGFIREPYLSGALAVLLFLRTITGYSLIIPPRLERRIKALGSIDGGRRTFPSVLEAGRESDIFDRIENYMKEKKPYLEEGFCLEDICSELLTNKLYVSKTINDCYEDNFRSYLNGYRIRHAQSVIDTNPGIKMSDVAVLSGYRCLATFNSSFKSITGLTPGEYSRQVIVRQRLSTNRGQEL